VRKSAPEYAEPYAGEDLARARIQVTTIGDLCFAADRHRNHALVLPGRCSPTQLACALAAAASGDG
jgi:hypothetical protein